MSSHHSFPNFFQKKFRDKSAQQFIMDSSSSNQNLILTKIWELDFHHFAKLSDKELDKCTLANLWTMKGHVPQVVGFYIYILIKYKIFSC